MTERWLPVDGYVGIYEVSDRGQVRSLSRIVAKISSKGNLYQCCLRERLLRQSCNAGGYLCVGLSREGVQQECYVHDLVLIAFAGPKQEGQEARHYGGLGQTINWWPENLCWGTHFENEEDKRRDGTVFHPVQTGSLNNNARLTEAQVREIRRRSVPDRVLSQVWAEEFGVCEQTIRNVVNFTTWSYLR